MKTIACISLAALAAASSAPATRPATNAPAGDVTRPGPAGGSDLEACLRCAKNFVLSGGCKDVANAELPDCASNCPSVTRENVATMCAKIPQNPCPRVDACGATERPTLDANKCPTCIPAQCDSITDPMKEACRAKMATTAGCEVGQLPHLTQECCLSCKPRLPPKPDQPCECETKPTDTCPAGERPVFDEETCCRSCKIERPKPAGRCTKDMVKTCFESMPPCEGRETPKPVQGCCRSCSRPQRKCDLKDVVKQCARTKKCGADETPTRVEGSCCFSCRPEPKCETPCGLKQVCTRKGCRGRKARKLAIRLSNKAFKAIKADMKEMKDLTEDERKLAVKALIEEVVQRFCDNVSEDRAKKCERSEEFLEALTIKALKKRVKKRVIAKNDRIKEADGVDLDVDVETLDTTSASRRLLDNDDLLDSALKDADSAEDMIESIVDGDDGASSESIVDGDDGASSASKAGFAVASFLAAWML